MGNSISENDIRDLAQRITVKFNESGTNILNTKDNLNRLRLETETLIRNADHKLKFQNLKYDTSIFSFSTNMITTIIIFLVIALSVYVIWRKVSFIYKTFNIKRNSVSNIPKVVYRKTPYTNRRNLKEDTDIDIDMTGL